MKDNVFPLFLAGILVNVTKRISTPHWNLCCPGPNFSQKKKKTTKNANADTNDEKHIKRWAERVPVLCFGQVDAVREYSYKKDS